MDLFLDLSIADLTATPRRDLAPDRMLAIVETVKARQSARAAEALGWYAYAGRQFAPAAAWFDLAMQWQPGAKAAEGHLLAVRQLPDRAAYTTLLQRYVALYPQAVKAAGPGPATGTTARSGREDRSGRAFAALKSGDAARCLSALSSLGSLSADERRRQGWCFLKADRPHEAAEAFTRAAAAGGSGAADAAYGLSLARLRAGETAAAVTAAEPLAADRRAEVGAIALAQEAIAAFDANRPGLALSLLERRRQFAAPGRDLEVLRAWAMLREGRGSDAWRLFRDLDAALSTPETRSGLLEATKTLEARRDH